MPVWVLPGPDGHVDLDVLMERLGAADIDSVLLEGGGYAELVGAGGWNRPEGPGVHRPQALRRGGRPSPVMGRGAALPAQPYG